MKQAFKKDLPYANPDKYRLFLKQKFTTLTPQFYGVVAVQRIETADGPMYAIKIDPDAISDPTKDSIAEVWINDEYVYLWRDHCWMVAVDKNNAPLSQRLTLNEFTAVPRSCNKVLVVHRIGSLTVE